MLCSLSFVVPGSPVAWARAGIGRGGKLVAKAAQVRFFTREKNATFERRVRDAWEISARGQDPRGRMWPVTGPVVMLVEAYWPMRGQPRKRDPRPKAPKGTRPDIDNLAKGILDALNGVAYIDDAQCVELHVRKMHAAQGDPPRVVVTVTELEDDWSPEPW